VLAITKPAVLIQGTRFGTVAELKASEAFVHLSKLGETIDIKELHWLASVAASAEEALAKVGGGISIPLYVKSFVVRQSQPLTDKSIDDWFSNIHTAPDDFILVILADLQGGRISDFSNDSTAYAHRDAMYTVAAYALALLPYPDDALTYLKSMVDNIHIQDANFGTYPGYIDPLLTNSEWPKQYWGDNYPRLKEIKAKYDPKNLFSNPQSVGQDGKAAPSGSQPATTKTSVGGWLRSHLCLPSRQQA